MDLKTYIYILCNLSNTQLDIVFTKLSSHSISSTCGKTNLFIHSEVLTKTFYMILS